ncbi:MAG: UvrD-helicase domain-containing protein [Balneolales bacterium]
MNSLYPTLEQITEELKKAEGNIIVEAGAGTGKTYNLTNRILYQVSEKGISLDQILAMTFTDYAAAEMRERVYTVVSEAIETESDENKRRHLIRQKREFSKNYISTFHSFCSRILKYYPDEVAEIPITKFPDSLDNEPYSRQDICYLDAGFEVLGTYDEILLKQELLKEFYKIYKDHPPLQAQLNMMHYTVLEEFLQKLSDKEDDELLRVAGMGPRDYLSCLKGLLKDLKTKQQPVIDRAWQMVQANRRWFKDPDAITGWEAFARTCIIKAGTIRLGKLNKEYKAIAAEELNPLLIEFCDKERFIEPLENYLAGDEDVILEELKGYRNNDEFNANHETWHSLIELADLSLRWSAFLRYKRVSKRTLNFDDIIWFIRRLFKEKPYIAEALSTRFKYIMIDEFQDTDEKQWEIIRALASLNTESKVLIVGDIKQAIYGFRGGDVTMMDRARSEIRAAKPGAYNAFELSWSFRSNDSVINFVNRLFDFSFNHAEERKPYMAEAQKLLRPPNNIGNSKNHPGEIRVFEGPGEAFGPDELTQPARKLYEDDACRLEALRIADFLDQIRRGEKSGYERISELMKQGQSAVGMLFKRRKNQHYYEQALKLYGLPYTVSSGRGFFNRQEIMDCHNLLAFLQDAFDDLSLVGVLRSPFVGLSDAGLLAVRNTMDDPEGKHYSTYWQAVTDWECWGENALIAPDKLALGMIPFLKSLRDKTPYSRVSDLLEEAVFDTNFLNGFIRDPQARQNAIKLIDIVRQLEMSGRGNMFEIVNFLRIQMEEEVVEADAELPEPGIIQLMTVHGSKGLEFPMVVLPDMCAYNTYGGSRIYETPVDDPLFDLPIFSYNPKDREGNSENDVSVVHKMVSEQCKQRDKAELIRLFYVATTRAESHLVLGHTVNYFKKTTDNRDGSFSKLLQGWMDTINDPEDSALFVHDILEKEKIEEISTRIRAGHQLPVNGEKAKRETVNFEKLSQVSKSASRGVKTVTQTKDEAITEWKVKSQWATISAADAGTIIHRALEVNPNAGCIDKLLVNLMASLGYPDADKLADENGVVLRRHIVNAQSSLDANFSGASRIMKEVPFEVEDDSSPDANFIRGTIDMLIQDNGGNWCLIDFKTALPEEGALAEFSAGQGYKGQLELYQSAFEKLTSGTILDEHVYILFTGFEGGRLLSLRELR